MVLNKLCSEKRRKSHRQLCKMLTKTPNVMLAALAEHQPRAPGPRPRQDPAWPQALFPWNWTTSHLAKDSQAAIFRDLCATSYPAATDSVDEASPPT
jgi:hypothetical protein